MQQELSQAFSLTVAYVGSSSSYLMGAYNWNGSAPGPLATEVARRKIPQWNNITLRTPYGHASYHGMDVQLERRYANGLALSAAYTWSHSLDNIAEQFGSGGGGLQDFRDFRSARAHSNFDLRQRFVAGNVWEIPIGQGKRWMNRGGVLNAMVGGWQLSNLLSWQTGNYFTVSIPNPRPMLGATGVADWWPDRIRDPRLSNPTTDQWFDTSAFILPRNTDGTFRFGNAGRAILGSDDLFNLDFGLMKNFSVTERIRAELRWETFNLTNTPTLGDPNTTLGNPDFGKVRSTVSIPRQMQFALRLEW